MSRVTIRDHPRVFCSPTQRSPKAQAFYKTFHDKATAEGWVVGGDPRIDWCLRHDRRTETRLDKSYCDACEEEATSFLSAGKIQEPARGRPLPKDHPNTRAGDVTGRKGGRVPSKTTFNRPLVIPRNQELRIYRDD